MTTVQNATPIDMQAMLQSKFQRAMALHQQGQLVQAHALYEAVLAIQNSGRHARTLYGYDYG